MMTKYFVHRYDTIRIKVAVEAASQAEAILAADAFLENAYPIQNFDNTTCETDEAFVADVGCPILIHHEPAEETTGYLVDEFGDEEYRKTKSYDGGAKLLSPGPSHWDEDPAYPIEDWKTEVENDDTRQSYADWVISQKELAA